MIYGYYCIHPELVDNHRKVASRKQRLEKLTGLGAPEVILVNEQRVYDELKMLHSDLSWLRNRVKGLYADGVQDDILMNYDAVFQEVGFDPAAAYSGKNVDYDAERRDYLRPLEGLTDSEVLAFLAYAQGKFDEYHEKHIPKLNEIRDLFISRIEQCIEHERYSKLTSDNLTRLRQAAIDIDDGFETTLEGCTGWYNAHRNQIMLSAIMFSRKGALVLFHECFHALAGREEGMNGFLRLKEFFGTDYGEAINLIDEAYANTQSIHIFMGEPPEWLKAEQLRDLKFELIVRRTGAHAIPREVFEGAYFSNSVDDVKRLADAIKSEFTPEELFGDLQSIKDHLSVEALEYIGGDKDEESKFLEEHRYDTIDAYYRYRCKRNYHMTYEEFLRALKSSAKKPIDE